MHEYHQKYGHLPPAYLVDDAGRPAHSWRVLLLEFLKPELHAAYKFDESWDGPNNRKLERHMPSYYVCPADREGKSRWRTNYFVVVGEGTAFPGAKAVRLEDIERQRAEAILLVESVGLDVHWMEPKDLSLDSMSFVLNDDSKPSVSSKHRKGPNICMVDATKRRLAGIAPDSLKELLTIKRGK
jgi:hypothetical protein